MTRIGFIPINKNENSPPPSPFTVVSAADISRPESCQNPALSPMMVSSIVGSIASPIRKLSRSFEERGLMFERISESQYVCPDSTFADLEEILKAYSLQERMQFGSFFYDPVHQVIIYDEEISRFVDVIRPTSNQWISLLKTSRENAFERESLLLTLSEGNSYSENQFTNDPLFKSTLEKHAVFRRLCYLQKTDDFQRKYQKFLTQDCFLPSDPMETAYLSLYAFLDGKLSREELFTSQLLTTVFLESPSSAKYTLLSEDNVEAYLQAYNYPTRNEHGNLLPSIEKLLNKTPLERTAVSYQVEGGIDRLVHKIYENTLLPAFGFKKQPMSLEVPEVTILPLDFLKDLYEDMFASEFDSHEEYPPTQHAEYFGYKKISEQLVNGRPVSCASPLFHLPSVHDMRGKQAAIFVHDVLGHCITDWMHHYSKHLVKLGLEIKKLEDPILLPFALEFLDRAVLPTEIDSDENVALFIRSVFKENKLHLLSQEKQGKLITLVRQILPRSVTSYLG